MEFIHFFLVDAVPFIQKFILILLTVDSYFKTEKYSTVHNPISKLERKFCGLKLDLNCFE